MGARQMPLQELSDGIGDGTLISDYEELAKYAVFVLPWNGGCYACWCDKIFVKEQIK